MTARFVKPLALGVVVAIFTPVVLLGLIFADEDDEFLAAMIWGFAATFFGIGLTFAAARQRRLFWGGFSFGSLLQIITPLRALRRALS